MVLRDYRQNLIMKKVTSWAAIIAVPTLVTGFYGMNVPYPGSEQTWGVFTVTDEKRLATMRHNALKRVNKYFTWHGVAFSCNQVYVKIIQGKYKKSKRRKVIRINDFKLKNAGYLLKEPIYLAHNLSAVNE